MPQTKIASTVRDFLSETHPDEVSIIQDDTNLFEIGILNSLLIVSMVVFLEDSFDCFLDHEDLTEENFNSLAAISHLISQKTA